MEQIRSAIEKAKHVVFLTGAGISTDSGILDYRGAKGVGQQINFEKVLSAESFREDPEEFWNDMFNIMKWGDLALKEPNIGHEWIADLVNHERNVTVITQNIDGLHEKAGSLRVINAHGTIGEGECPKCGYDDEIALASQRIPKCKKCGEILKPDVVLYGEDLPRYMEALDATLKADVFIAMGTSLKVFPIAGLVEQARIMTKAEVFIVNNEATAMNYCADRFYEMSISDFVNKYNQ
jgi:NAD-dependent deacetylase